MSFTAEPTRTNKAHTTCNMYWGCFRTKSWGEYVVVREKM